MASSYDTLNIGTIRLKRDYPVAEVEAKRRDDPVNHPEAAAAARARIAALPDRHPLRHPEMVPATPTADLITDRAVLAERVKRQPLVARPKLPPLVTSLLSAAGIFALVLLLFKSPIIISQLGYSLSASKPPAPTASGAPAVANIIPTENTITIPKINIHAPVQYEPSVAEANIQHALESGVVHYGNTALPGQAGNVAIFGHSSNDWWEPGNFKFVFVLLDKLAPGDRLTVDYQSKRYTYEVTGSKVVEPTDVSVLNPTAAPTLSLITCTPPGTSLRRLVVTARQVDPDPTRVAATTATPTGASGTLPSSAPSFLEQLGQAWDGIVHGFKSLFGGDTNAPSPTASPNVPGGQLPAVK